MNIKSIFTTAFIASFGVSVFATTDVELIGGAGDSTTRVAIPGGDYNVILKSPETTVQGAMFKGGSATITSLDATDTASQKWSFSGQLNVDVNSSVEGSVDGVDFGNNKVQWNVGTLNVRNSSATNNTFVNVNLGEEFSFTVNNPSSDSDILGIRTSANVTGKTLTFKPMANGYYVVQDATVNHSVVNTYFASGSTLWIRESNFNMAENSRLTFYKGSRLDLSMNSTMVAYKITTEATANMNIIGDLIYKGTSALSTGILTLNKGSLTANDLTGNTNARVKITGANSIIKGRATMNIKGALEITSGADFTVDSTSGKITLTDFDELYNGRIILSGGKLTIYKDVFKRVSTYGTELPVKLLFTEKNNEFVVNATTTLEQLYAYGNTPEMKIAMSENEDVKLVMTGSNSLNIAAGVTATIIFSGIDVGDERVFFVSSKDAFTLHNSYTFISEEGYDFDFVKGTYNGQAGFWMMAVPEPAEWAMIFGAIALGLAVYRRRK